jgi:hypothetical protein
MMEDAMDNFVITHSNSGSSDDFSGKSEECLEEHSDCPIAQSFFN